MWNFLHDKAIWVYGTFHNNETIIWARLQMVMGAAWLAISTSDMSPLISDPKLLGGWLVFNSFMSEYLRRRGANFTSDDNKDAKEPA